MHEFDVVVPRNLEEAIENLEIMDDSWMIKAGGTDLLVWIKKGAVHPDVVLDITRVPEISGVTFFPHRGLKIGALATVTEVAENADVQKYFPTLLEGCLTHSDPLIRNKATVVGNVCAGVPSGDMFPCLGVYEAVVHTIGPDGARSFPIDEFVTGPRKTLRHKNEIVTHLWIPIPEGKSAGCVVKLGRRNSLDLAQVCLACLAVDKPSGREYRIVCGAVAPKPIRATAAEAMLKGVTHPNEALLEEVALAAMGMVSPISDIRASKEYRLDQVGELTKRVVRTCSERM